MSNKQKQRYLDPKIDVAFKKVFSDKVRLMDLLNCILKLPEGRKIIDLDYVPTEQVPLFIDGRRSLFDLKVTDETGRWYIVEMQNEMEKYYLNRAQFYGSYTYVNQIGAGDEYYTADTSKVARKTSGEFAEPTIVGEHKRVPKSDTANLEVSKVYKDLLPVIVVSIMGSKVFPDDLPYINYHKLLETSTNKQYLFSVSYVFVELGKFDENNIKDSTDEWLHMLKCAHKEQQPPQAIKNDKVLSAYTALEQYNWTVDEHDAYIRAHLAQSAEKDSLEEKYKEGEAKGEAKGRAEGEAKGRAEGEAKGRAEGEIKKAIAMAKEMLADNEPIEKIIKYTKLSQEEIAALTGEEAKL